MMSLPILLAIVWAVSLGGLGAVLTDIGSWYHDLAKPRWQPPDWLFGPAWTLILALAAWAGVLAWNNAPDRSAILTICALYATNFVFHLAWSPLFFKARRPDWALIEVVPLWLSVLALCVMLRTWSVTASWMIVPYLAWVSFAAILNWKIVRLNGPSGSR